MCTLPEGDKNDDHAVPRDAVPDIHDNDDDDDNDDEEENKKKVPHQACPCCIISQCRVNDMLSCEAKYLI